MDMTRPTRAVIPSLDGPVLETLARTTQALTGRQVHALTGIGSVAGVQRVLARLSEQGVVSVTEAGRAAHLYTLNRGHLAAPAIEILANLRSILRARLQDEIAGWRIAPTHASLFGSAARGDGDSNSDLDLLIIRPDTIDGEDPAWRNQLDSLSEHAAVWTGNHAQLYEIDELELREHVAAQESIVDDWRRDGILLAGSSVPDLLARIRKRRRR